MVQDILYWLGQIKKKFVAKLLCCQNPNAECVFCFFCFFLFYFFIAQFLCERSITLLFLLYKIVVQKKKIQKCKYIGHVSFIYHVWYFCIQPTILKVYFNAWICAWIYAWKWNRVWVWENNIQISQTIPKQEKRYIFCLLFLQSIL